MQSWRIGISSSKHYGSPLTPKHLYTTRAEGKHLSIELKCMPSSLSPLLSVWGCLCTPPDRIRDAAGVRSCCRNRKTDLLLNNPFRMQGIHILYVYPIFFTHIPAKWQLLDWYYWTNNIEFSLWYFTPELHLLRSRWPHPNIYCTTANKVWTIILKSLIDFHRRNPNINTQEAKCSLKQ